LFFVFQLVKSWGLFEVFLNSLNWEKSIKIQNLKWSDIAKNNKIKITRLDFKLNQRFLKSMDVDLMFLYVEKLVSTDKRVSFEKRISRKGFCCLV
jgi:hypothetical protein